MLRFGHSVSYLRHGKGAKAQEDEVNSVERKELLKQMYKEDPELKLLDARQVEWLMEVKIAEKHLWRPIN